jgi:hypothetical protein
MIVGYSFCDVARMRTLNPDGIFLLQPGLDSVPNVATNNVHTTYGAQSQWKGGSDTVSDGSAANLGYMRAFDPTWDYLYNADGSAAPINTTYGHKGWNLADPKGKGTPELMAKLIAYAAKQGKLYRNGWDGIHGDNWSYGFIGKSFFYGPKLDTDRDGTVDDLSLLRRNFDSNLVRAGHLLRSYLPGKIVGGNNIHWGADGYFGSEPDGWLKSANYTLFEDFQGYYHDNPGGFVRKIRQWLDYPDPKGMTRYLATLHTAAPCGSQVPAGANPNQNQYMLNSCVMKSMRWGLTMVLLTNGYYEVYPRDSHGALWWYDEYDGGVGIRKRGYLGKAVGDPQQLSTGVWRRDFANGIALNNSTSATKTVSLESPYKRLKGTQNPTLNSGAQVTSVSIPEHDGIILLRTGSTGAVTAPPAETPTSFQVSSTTLSEGQTLSGAVNWDAAATSTSVSKIEFLIDGKLRWTETLSPYQFSGNNGVWDTTKETNGTHTLSLRGVATDGKVATSSITVSVANGGAGFQVLTQTPADGATVQGAVRWEAVSSGATVKKIEFMVDGALRWTEGTGPYLFNGNGTWDTTKETNGSHALSLRATAVDGRVTTSGITVTVSQ